MIETLILNHLTLCGFSASLEIPEGGVAPPLVLIERTGGGEENHIRRATVALQSYGASLYLAASLNEQVKATMEDFAALPEIARCELNNDCNFTDTTKRLYRYQAVYDIMYY